MSKKRAIVYISLVAFFTLIFGAMAAFPSTEVGIYDVRGFGQAIRLGIELRGGVVAVFTVTDVPDPESEIPVSQQLAMIDQNIDGTVRNLTNMLISRGYTEAVVTRQGQRQIRVEVPDVSNPDEFFRLIGRPNRLEFRLPDSNEALVNGKDHLISATAGFNTDQLTNQQVPVVLLRFNSEGATAFGEATQKAIDLSPDPDRRILQIWVGNEMVSAPRVSNVINNTEAVITGVGNIEQARELALRIQSGAHNVSMQLAHSATTSATLGIDAIRTSIIAAIIGIMIIFIVLISIYKLPGVAACVALISYVVLVIMALGLLNEFVQLSLSGIAGIILGIGMAVDANVIIFERIKDEARSGKPLAASVNFGFKRAIGAVLDANFTTMLSAIVLIFVSQTRSFGITLLISIVISLFTALVLTQGLLKWFMVIAKKKDKLYFKV
jgi:preprotein translocase subunit SecD